MSSALPAAEPGTPASAAPRGPANAADAPPVESQGPAPVVPPAAANGGEDSLQKLLQHMEGLQNQNSELVEVLETLAASKRQELDGIIEQRLMPWINDLQIPGELKENFIRGIKDACLKPTDKKSYKSLLNFQANPVLEVMCGAAQAHGEAIRKVEDTRRELQDATLKSQQLHADASASSRRVESTADRVMFAKPDDRLAGGKRAIDDVAPDEAPQQSRCWNALFESFN
jgi:hypothetical protein